MVLGLILDEVMIQAFGLDPLVLHRTAPVGGRLRFYLFVIRTKGRREAVHPTGCEY